jgi:hypothetical protein
MSLTTVHVESNVAARSARDALSPVRLWLALAKINQPEFDLSRPPRLSFDVRWTQMEDSPVKTSLREFCGKPAHGNQEREDFGHQRSQERARSSIAKFLPFISRLPVERGA